MFLFSYCSFKSELECFGIILQALPFDMISVEKMRTLFDETTQRVLSDPQLIFDDVFSVQVKEIIMRSVVKTDHPVTVRSGGTLRQVSLSEICVSGGIVNAYQALQLAAKY